MIPPARAVGVFFTIDRVCSPCKRADGLSMMGCFKTERTICDDLATGGDPDTRALHFHTYVVHISNLGHLPHHQLKLIQPHFGLCRVSRKTHLKQTAKRLAELVGEVVLGIDRQVVLKNIDRVLAALVRCSSLGSLRKGKGAL